MTAHLIAATVTALIATAAALLLRRRSAALRHAILLAALLGFVTPTPWLNRAGDKLAACLASPPGQSLLNFEALLNLESLLARAPLSVKLTPSAESRSQSQLGRDALWLLWAVVFAFSLARWLRRSLQAVPSVREANIAEAEALQRAKDSLRLNRNVNLRITACDRVPGALGCLRPCVILPDQLSDQLSEAELHAILAHELAHIARRDNLSAAVARVIVSAFWFHPLLWWIERRMLAEREAACDELVLAHGADPADYVAAILKVCRMSFEGAASFASSAEYAGATGSNLEHRMEQIMSAHVVRPSSRLLRAIPAAVLVFAALLPVAGGFLRGQDQAPPQSTTHSANDAAYQHAYECYNQGRFQEAEYLFRQIYILDPEDHRSLAGLVETYRAENRPNDAIQLMQEETDKHPDQADLRIFLANLYVHTEKYDQAIAEYQRALDTSRNLSSAATADLRFRMAEAYRRKGDLNAAIDLFRAAAAASPKDIKALMQLALLMEGTGREDQAAVVYEQILKLDPNNVVALNNLAYIMAEKGIDLDMAQTMAQRAHEKAPDSPEITDTLGWIYIKLNLSEKAVPLFQDLVSKEPTNPKFYYHLGMALLQRGDRSGAIEKFRKALDSHPSFNDAPKIRTLLAEIAP